MYNFTNVELKSSQYFHCRCHTSISIGEDYTNIQCPPFLPSVPMYFNPNNRNEKENPHCHPITVFLVSSEPVVLLEHLMTSKSLGNHPWSKEQPPFPDCPLVPACCHRCWDSGRLIWEIKLDCCPKSTLGSPCCLSDRFHSVRHSLSLWIFMLVRSRQCTQEQVEDGLHPSPPLQPRQSLC